MSATAKCGYDSDDWHIHEYEIPQSDGYHLAAEERVHEGAVHRAAAWRVREPLEPWLPAPRYTCVGQYASVGDAFAALAPGVAVPAVECAA